jgi:hypothetical protein
MRKKEFSVPEGLRNAANIFEERALIYGKNYTAAGFGSVMLALFQGKTVELKTANDHARFGILVQCASKMLRYANAFPSGGHKDSLDDLSVYSQILSELDQLYLEQKAKENEPQPKPKKAKAIGLRARWGL